MADLQAAASAIRAEAASLDTPADAVARARALHGSTPRRQGRGWLLTRVGIVVLACAAVAGPAVLVARSDSRDEQGSSAPSAPSTTTRTNSTTVSTSPAPVPVSVEPVLETGWDFGRGRYVGAGLNLAMMPPGFGRGSVESGDVRKVSVTSRSADDPVLYAALLEEQDSPRRVWVGITSTGVPPDVMPAENAAWRAVDGITVAVAVEGFESDSATASRILGGVTFDAERVDDRDGVPGAYGSILTAGETDVSEIGDGDATTTGGRSWTLLQDETLDSVFCVRLVIPTEALARGGHPICLPRDPGGLTEVYVVIGLHRFVMDSGGSTPSIREVRPDEDFPLVLGRDGAVCDPAGLARASGVPAIAFVVVDCRDTNATIAELPASPSGPTVSAIIMRGDDGEWIDRFGPPPVYLGGGLSASFLPDAFQRPGGVLGGPFSMLRGEGDGEGVHRVVLTTLSRPRQTLEIGYVRGGIADAPFRDPILVSMTEGDTTFWVAGVDTAVLSDVLVGLSLDDGRRSDDGDAGEFGSLVARSDAGPAWRVRQGMDLGPLRCYVLTEGIQRRPTRPADEFCLVNGAAAPSTDVVVRNDKCVVRDPRGLVVDLDRFESVEVDVDGCLVRVTGTS